MGDFGVKDQGAFSPLWRLFCEAVAAIPTTGGAVTALLTMRVGIVVAAVLDVSWAVNHDDVKISLTSSMLSCELTIHCIYWRKVFKNQLNAVYLEFYFEHTVYFNVVNFSIIKGDKVNMLVFGLRR